MRGKILGISAFYHDSAAALVSDGNIVAAAQEERFSRRKHDPRFPRGAVEYCLHAGGIHVGELDCVVFYDKPLVKFERMLQTYLAWAPRGLSSFTAAMPIWIKEKLFIKSLLRRELAEIAGCGVADLPPIRFTEHHQAHAASAFFPSPFESAGVLCLDGVGEWATTSIWLGQGNRLTPQWQIDFPHSLGLLYSAFTYFAGFKVNSGEYKLMGLAPYGTPRYRDLILERLIDLKPDGSFRLNMKYFDFATGLRMTNARFDELFGGPPRKPESPLTAREMDLASSIQLVTEEVVLKLANTVHRELGAEYLCMAGGVALNCVANGRVLRESPFRDVFVQPAAGDAGGAIGAALAVWHEYEGRPRTVAACDSMRGAYLGPCYGDEEIRAFLDSVGAGYRAFVPREEIYDHVARLLADEKIVGWFQGRMEFGPRALGARSILGDPRNPHMQSVMNLKIKFRESFRPFAPAVLAERVSDYFELDRSSPYMMLVAGVRENLRTRIPQEQEGLSGLEKLKVPRSTIPAVTHVDYSARVQTVHRETNPALHELLSRFEALTGCAVLVNTSFNVRGEPIVCTPADAYRCFMHTEMDHLVIERFILDKQNQPVRAKDESWMQEFDLD